MARYKLQHIHILFFISIICSASTSKAEPPIAPTQQQTPTLTTLTEQPSITAPTPTTALPEPNTNPIEQQSLDIAIPTKMVGGKQEIPIGVSLPLKGEASLIGNQIFDGMSIFFNKLQAKKTKIPFIYKLEALNDDGDIKKMRANIKQLQTKSPLFLNFWGPDSTTSILKFLKTHSVYSLFPLEGVADHRTRENKNFIYLRPAYEQQIEALVHYSINTLNRKKIAIFYEASELGEDALAALKRVLKKYDLPLIAEGSYQQGTLNVQRAVDEIASKSPNAILCFGYPRPTYNFIRQIVNKGLYKTVILGLDTLTLIQKPLKRSRGIKIITSSVVPDPQRSTLKIVEQYRADMAKYAPNKTLSIFSLEGYINAALLVECTKLVSFPLTTQKLIQSIENIKNVRFKGLALNFNPETRTFSNQIWIDPGEDKEWFLSNITTEEAQDEAPAKQTMSEKK